MRLINLHQRWDFRFHRFQRGQNRLGPARCDIGRDTAWQNAVHHQPMAESGGNGAECAFAQQPATRMGEGEGRVIADKAPIIQMIMDAFQFQHQRTEMQRARRRRDTKCRLHRRRKRPGMRHRGIARKPRRITHRRTWRGAEHERKRTLMLIAKPLFQPHHGFSLHGKAEMPGFDHAGMDGTNRDLVNAFPFRWQKFGLRGLARKGDGLGGKRMAQGPAAVIQPRAQINRAFRAMAP